MADDDPRSIPPREQVHRSSLRGNDDEEVSLLVCTETLRPGCVLVQALGARGNYKSLLSEFTNIWLLAPTPTMALIKGKIREFREVFRVAEKEMEDARKKKSAAQRK